MVRFIFFTFFLSVTASTTRPLKHPTMCCLAKTTSMTFINFQTLDSSNIEQVHVFLDFTRGLQVNKFFSLVPSKGLTIFSTSVLMDFEKGWSYEFQETAEGWSQCYKRPLPVKAPLQCVPGFASPVLGNQDDVPGQLGTEPWDVWRADQDEPGVTLTYGFARDSCRPAFIRQRGQLHNTTLDMEVLVTNYKESVEDMAVFDHPNSCHLTHKSLPYPWKTSTKSSLTANENVTIASWYIEDKYRKERYYAPPLLGTGARESSAALLWTSFVFVFKLFV
ncbi:uncharacterized protein LOC112560379 [Pomacea canaliculata]|uniref:uncharacterized protein LOC112560379 n=1 Tax=Pomacea canaliculata TaxID=400727 RepID=UPI000D72CD99|nr:uncharacterized protein LOC112560379 [Pomacea canaliculata]XP_025087991.1 uncharacterized protein LOC112560379 [Pomacea canaliculata]